MTTSAETSSLSPVLPFQLGRFTLCRELGAGGMATVYLSRMQLAAGLDRVVALKTIHSHLAKEQTFVDMFLDEAKIASQISHPNVCSVFDFGEVGGTYFLAMEYLAGEPLIDVVNAIAAQQDEDLLATLPFLAARILADACEGLHAAHALTGPDGSSLEVVHRDVSPQNLVVTYEGSVKVVDFGCAKALERVTQTNTGMMKGKVSYAAPEQLRAEPLDARVDVFALGVCLWECLTLRQLFRRDTPIATAMAVLEEPIPRADDGCPWVPAEMADIAQKALARDREDRYTSARELGRALRGFIARSGVPFEGAEVAEWMRSLFRDGHEKKREMIANVEAMERSRVAPRMAGEASGAASVDDSAAASAGSPSAGLSDAGASSSGVAREHTSSPEVPVDAASGASADDEPIALPTRTGRYLFAAAVVLALVGGGGYAWMNQSSGAPEDVARTANEPSENGPEADEATTTTAEAPEQDLEGGSIGAAADEAPSDRTTNAQATASPEPSPPGAPAQPERARPVARAQERPSSTTPSTSPSPTTAPIERGTTLDFSRGPVRVAATGGWATVFHGDRELGRTPLDTTLPVGRQRLRVLPFGRGPARTVEVDVEWGARASVTIPVGDGTWANPY